jgi:hypothetical protein
MPDCPAFGQPGTGVRKKTNDVGPIMYQTKPTQSGIYFVLHWTAMMQARMPMPTLVSSMLMPSYD